MAVTHAHMSQYEREQWAALTAHWDKRSRARELPHWMQGAGAGANATARRAADLASSGAHKMTRVVPTQVREQAAKAGGMVVDRALEPTIRAVLALMDFTNDLVREYQDPEVALKIANNRGYEVEALSDLRRRDLSDCDALLRRHALKWRGIGTLEGAGTGALALIPVPGVGAGAAIMADVVVVQALSTAICTRVAFMYGYDATSIAEQDLMDRIVRKSLFSQAAKAKPLTDVNKAAVALAGRQRWSDALRNNHRIVAALEKLMRASSGKAVGVRQVAKTLPGVSVVLSAGINSHVLAKVAKDAQRVYQTRFLVDKYGLPSPVALSFERVESEGDGSGRDLFDDEASA